eukprot:3588291-Prymnesium_polylepis.1
MGMGKAPIGLARTRETGGRLTPDAVGVIQLAIFVGGKHVDWPFIVRVAALLVATERSVLLAVRRPAGEDHGHSVHSCARVLR